MIEPASRAAAAARIDVALRLAGAAAPEGAAWHLRYALDDLLRVAGTPPARQPEDWLLAELGLADLLVAPYQAHGSHAFVAEYHVALARRLAAMSLTAGLPPAAAARLERVAGLAESSAPGQAGPWVRQALEGLREGVEPTLLAGRPGASGLDPLDELASQLSQAISVGAPAYNAGDIEGCLRVYRETARRIVQASAGAVAASRSFGSDGPARLLEEALADAAKLGADQAAWRLRRAFDAILAEAGRLASSRRGR